MRDPDVSAVIVTWNSSGEIGNCIDSLLRNSDGLEIEIIVVDNASEDGTQEIVRDIIASGSHRIKLLQNDSNEGYTSACNRGMKVSAGAATLLMNPDTVACAGSVTKLFGVLSADGLTGAVAPRLLNSDGSIQQSVRRFPTYRDMFFEFVKAGRIFPGSKFFNRWKMGDFGHDRDADVEQPMAAALMVKSDVLSKVGHMDERFKMFFNDVDLCMKIRNAGFRILFVSGAEMIHEKGASIRKARKEMVRVWNNDCLKFFKKYRSNFFRYNLLKAALYASAPFRK